MLLTSTICLISKRAKHSEGSKEVFCCFFLTVLCTSAGSSNARRHFDSFSCFFFFFGKQCLCFKANSTYLPFPHFAHNWHSSSSAAFGGICVLVDLLLRVSHQSLAPEVKLFTWTGSPHLAVKMLRGDALTHAQWDGCGPEGRRQAVNVARCYNCSFKVIHFKWLI